MRPRGVSALIAVVGFGATVCACGGTATTTAADSPPVAARAQPAAPHLPPAGVPSPPVAARAQAAAPRLPRKPRIMSDPIPFGPRRKAEMLAYAERHYNLHTYRLVDPQVIVEHFTETPDFRSTFNTFAPDVPDTELHELPGTCAHFVIDRDGTIHQLVPLGLMCRHTVGLNWTAIGIEHVGYSDAQVLGNARQMRASLALTRWLSCRLRIKLRNVIGHNESVSSPFHHEDVARLRTQTHDDFKRADMQVYRARLRSLGGCSS